MNLKLSTQVVLAIAFLLSSSILALPQLSSAQSFVSGQDITINQSSSFPKPNSPMTLEASSNSFDINKADVSWYLNGVLEQSGKGLDLYSFTIGPAGSESRVSIVITTNRGSTIKKDLSFRPASVDLVYESLSGFKPPLYKGKVPATHLSPVKVVAFANFTDGSGKTYQPNEIIYKWTVNRDILSESSGLGRNQMTFSGPTYHKSADVRVDAETVDGKFLQARQINIKAEDPKVLFYEDHPTLGLLTEKAYLSQPFNLIEEEVTLSAVPFGMTNLNSFRDVEYQWSLNGKKLLPIGDRNKVILRNEGLDGTAVLRLDIYNNKKILQFAKSAININFGSAAFENLVRSGDSGGPGRTSFFNQDKETFFGTEE